jgi:hypothetical protein
MGRCCRAVGLGRRLAKPPSPRISEIGLDMEEIAMPVHITLTTTIELIILRVIPPIPIENSPIQVEFELSSTVFQGKGGTVTGSLGGQATIAPFSGGQVVGGMISFTAPKAGIFPLILTYSEPSAPNIAQGSHPLPVAARFLVQLDSCTINRTRALQNDTDFAAISACTDRDPPQSQSKFLGDLQSGNTAHPIGLTLGPFDIVPGSQDALCFSFTIINSGFAGSAQQRHKMR